MSNSTLTAYLSSKKNQYQKNLDPKTLKKTADQNALSLFKKAAKSVPAYNDFLKKNRIKPDSIKTIKDFQKVPPTTKDNYIKHYSADSRCWNGSLETNHIISTSSGTTGKPHYWPRNLDSEIAGAYLHELLFKDIWQIDKKKTLFINGFALGNWIAGTFTQAAINLLSWKGYPLISMTPGYNTDEIIEIVKEVAPQFDQVIISGHSPFLKEVAETAQQASSISWSDFDTKLLGTGQGITENWREYVTKLLGSKKINSSILNAYGSADTALMAFESPQTVAIRRWLTDHPDKLQKIFNDSRVPSLFSYDPTINYFEAIAGELHITKDTGCPLIRYNMLDQGGTIKDSNQQKLLNQTLDQTPQPLWNQPFVYLFGRDKFMVKLFGANIYTEHVQHALNHHTLQPHLTGQFTLELSYDNSHNPTLECYTELTQDTSKSSQLENQVVKIFIQEVTKINSEFKDALSRMGKKAKPKINLVKYGHPKHFPKEKVKKTA